MVKEFFNAEWEKMLDPELQRARQELAAIVESIDKEKDKSLREVIIQFKRKAIL